MGDSDLEALMSTPEPITESDQSSPASELLAEFSEEDSDVEDDSVEFSHDDLEGTSEEVWSADEAESFDEEEGLPSPPPPEPEPEVDTLLDEEDLPVPPVPESEKPSSQPEIEEESEPQSRIVQQDCSQCQQRFEVALPEGHDIARTACPSCGAIETVRLS